MWKKTVFTISLTLAVIAASAQTGLCVDTLFSDYGRLRGSVLIDLAKDVLGDYTQINRYKCLIISESSVKAKQVEDAVKRDFGSRNRFGNGLVLKEIIKNGQVRTVYYLLGKDSGVSFNEYVLYSRRNDKITLVYLNGEFAADNLNEELEMLKNLFIKVNDKQIKLF